MSEVELSEEQVDRIARRVIELMGESVVREMAWEVLPDMAEVVIKERIGELEAEVAAESEAAATDPAAS